MARYAVGLLLLFVTISTLCSQSCPKPAGLVSANIKATSAGVFWQEIQDAQTYKVEWRAQGGMFWTSATTLLNSYRILYLDLCSDYEVRVRANCGGGDNGDYSDPISFTTNCIPDCDAPIGNFTTNITDSTALLNWTTADSTAFILRYREVGDTIWQEFNVNAQQFFLGGLEYCTEYEWQIATLCPWADGDFGLLRTFSTYCGQCEAPEGLTVYGETQTGALFAWRGSAGAIGYEMQWREQGQGGWQAPQFTPLNGFTLNDLEPCKMYEYRTRSICLGDTSDWSMFPIGFSTLCSTDPCDPILAISVDSIDLDFINISWAGDSTVAGYTVQYREASGAGWTSLYVLPDGFVTVPNLLSCTDYQIRIRTNCLTGVSVYSDTTLVKTACLICNPITGLTTSGVGYTEASFVWSDVPSSLAYEFHYRETGGPWIKDTLSVNSITLSNLNPCTNYRARVRSICQNINSDWTDILLFQTQCCDVPNGLEITDIQPGNVSLNWNNASNGLWLVRYQEISDTVSTSFFSNANTTKIESLADCSTYLVEVASICGADTSAWSSSLTFDSYCCPTISDLEVDTALSLSKVLSWNTTSPSNWIVDLLNVNSGQNTTILTDTNEVVLNNLEACSDYIIILSNSCGAQDSISFSTICCPSVNNPSVSIQGGNVTLIWQGDSSNTEWVIEGEDVNTGVSVGPFTAQQAMLVIEDLPECGVYLFTITSKCGGVPSPSISLNFTTPCCPVPVISVDSIGYDLAMINWSGDNLSTYSIQIIHESDTSLLNSGVALNYTLNNLDSCTMYEIAISADCNGFPSAFSEPIDVMTLCTSSSLETETIGLQIFPNPASSYLNIISPLQMERVEIIDSYGKSVYWNSTHLNEVQISMQDYPAGLYILQCIIQEKNYAYPILLSQ